NLFAASAHFWRDAFAADAKLAENMSSGARYNAALAAALAGCGQGKDTNKLDHKDRATWRQQALAWLRADLAWWRRQSQKGDAQTKAVISQGLRQWQTDAFLAAVREKASLAKLPEAERKQWQNFWGSVENLRRQAAAAR